MAGSASSAIGAFARRLHLARSAASDRRGRGRGRGRGRALGSSAPRSAATAPGLERRRRISSSGAGEGMDRWLPFVFGVIVGGSVVHTVFRVGKAFVDKTADVRREKMLNAFLRAESRKKDEDIARLEKAWEEEVASREKKHVQ